MPRVLRCILTINEVQRSNGVTRRHFVNEWCGCCPCCMSSYHSAPIYALVNNIFVGHIYLNTHTSRTSVRKNVTHDAVLASHSTENTLWSTQFTNTLIFLSLLKGVS